MALSMPSSSAFLAGLRVVLASISFASYSSACFWTSAAAFLAARASPRANAQAPRPCLTPGIRRVAQKRRPSPRSGSRRPPRACRRLRLCCSATYPRLFAAPGLRSARSPPGRPRRPGCRSARRHANGDLEADHSAISAAVLPRPLGALRVGVIAAKIGLVPQLRSAAPGATLAPDVSCFSTGPSLRSRASTSTMPPLLSLMFLIVSRRPFSMASTASQLPASHS